MANRKKKLLLLLLVLNIFSCSSGQYDSSIGANRSYIKEDCVPLYHTKKPSWTYETPDDGSLHYSIGLSDYEGSEQSARDKAQKDAIKRVALYIGAQVLHESKTIIKGSNLSTDIYNPEIVRKEMERLLIRSMAREIKPVKWYIEKCVRIYKGEHKREFYRAYVLATVSSNRINIMIKQHTKEQKQIALKVKKMQENIKKARTLISRADNFKKLRSYSAYQNYNKALELIESVQIEAKILEKSALESNTILKIIQPLIKKTEKNRRELLSEPDTMIRSLLIGMLEKSKKRHTIAVARVLYQNTELSTDLSNYFISSIEKNLASENDLCRLVARRDFEYMLIKQNASIEDCYYGRVKIPITALVFARYWERGSDLELFFELKETGSRRLIDSVSITLPGSAIPTKGETRPSNTALEVWKAFTQISKSTNFRVKIFPEKGESSMYRQGDLLRFSIKANRNCYVYVYYVDVKGTVTLVFPNPYNNKNYVKANRIYTIPVEGSGFQLEVSPPFGNEILKVFALEKKVRLNSNPDKKFLKYKNISDFRARGIKIRPENKRAEDVCTVKTMRSGY